MSKRTELSAERRVLRDELRKLEDAALRGRTRKEAIAEANCRLRQDQLLSYTTVGGWFEKGIPARDFQVLWALVEVLEEWSGRPPADTLTGRDRAVANAGWAVRKKLWKTWWEDASTSRTVTSRSAVPTRHLDAYLKAAGRAARDHPYPGVLPGTTPPLASVYLRQQTAPWTEQTPGGSGGESRGHPGPLRGPADTRPALQVLAEQHACVVLAGPGGGKSSLLRTHLAHSAERWMAGQRDAPVAVLVTAADLVHRPLTSALASAVNAHLPQHGLTENLPEEFFSAPPQPGTQWLVLVDGLDEVTDPKARREVLLTITNVVKDSPAGPYRFVVATRPLPGNELDALDRQWPRHELMPFTVDQLPAVAGSWFRAAGLDDAHSIAERFVQDLQRASLTDLARIPLMASMLCQLHAADPSRPLPQSRGKLYGDFIGLLHRHQDTPGPAGARQEAQHVLNHLHDLIAHLAAERHNGNNEPALDIVKSHPEAQGPPRIPEDQWREFLSTALRRSGLLTVRAGELVFLHQTLQEYLAARHATHDPHTRDKAVHRAFHHPARYLPSYNRGVGLLPPDAPGVRPRLWLRRYWQPPTSDDGNLSYIGFLLDTAREFDPHAVDPYLNRLASRRAGLHGCEFIASQVRLGTLIPPDTVRATADLFLSLATDTTLGNDDRVWAARGLGKLGDPRAADLFLALATDATLTDWNRVEAARELAELGDPRAADLFLTLATDTALDSGDRVWAARGLGERGDPRAADLFLSLATDTALDSGDRVWAARGLGERGDPRAADLLHTLATDTTLGNAGAREWAAWGLGELGDPRAADLFLALATDTTLTDWNRVEAARQLGELGDAPPASAFGDQRRNGAGPHVGRQGEEESG
ncbi:NACHT domain-containing protein [Streptomyces hoynatensis]|uniref:Novel STAND NTPase 1 domain-containing protein n=1 Tax=Streptomyces hoynatensis TaxID=1141874 RepID=A0A3A9YJ76_9ACTN|nr:HEAT repeat domain-containing protein [Streptomyces hoynatensis]RKN36779.1 hypothetical protein D7294_29670 [Streptomyces hoynatensis]